MEKERLDRLMQARGLVSSREQARRLIMAGEVLVNGEKVDKPGAQLDSEARLEVKERPRYVSRGGLKLEAALRTFAVPVDGMVAADVGASTGGFTDCLLQHGAIRVYAIDVGYGQLAWGLRQDPRVIVMERTNARYLTVLPEVVDLATIDVSFISLKLVIPPVLRWTKEAARIVALIKPQFEAGRSEVGRKGVVRDRLVHRAVLLDLTTWAQEHGLSVLGLIPSPLEGPAGNIEFLMHLQSGSAEMADVRELVGSCLAKLDGATGSTP
jgi:23S rRNA (cytidine1920-2'-O)/16S rRNA (cytidine1409-2'-O)-methyltransferase